MSGHEATLKAVVIYRRQGGDVTFMRPVVEWYQSVPHPEGGLIQRFDLVEFAAPAAQSHTQGGLT